MYLNVSLTPPPSATEGSCSTPKTPEILNSIMSLTSPPFPPSYAHYQNQVGTSDLLSPVSSISSPCEELSATQFGLQTPTSSSSQNVLNKITAGGSFILSRPRNLSGGTPTLTGTPSPPVPELPSPVNTVEATKTALIKEGLKHQIKSKLKAAGVSPTESLPDVKMIKEENISEEELLTPEDEERRRRRRERNKIAATKCRNKKKERTCILLSESEVVEDQNLRLKSEIKRLEKERAQLEKILRDPSHRASCRHKSDKKSSSIPKVIVTPPDAPDATTSPPRATGLSPNVSSPASSSQPSSSSINSISNAGHPVVSYCQTNPCSSEEPYHFESPYPCEPTNVLSYDPSVSPSSSISDAFTPLSPMKSQPHLAVPTSSMSNTPYSSVQTMGVTLGPSTSQSLHMTKTYPVNDKLNQTYIKEGRELPPSNPLVPKHSLTLNTKRYMPYQVIRHSNEGILTFPSNKNDSRVEEATKEGDFECYLPVTTEEEQIQGSLYMYPQQSSVPETHYQMSDRKDINPMIKNRSQPRYNHYSRVEREAVSTPILTDVPPEMADNNYYQQNNYCQISNPIYADASQNQYYPQCHF